LKEKAGERYKHVRRPPDELRQAMLNSPFGFSCTYFPYSFLEECGIQQGEDWARINRPHDASTCGFRQSPDTTDFVEKVGVFSVDALMRWRVLRIL